MAVPVIIDISFINVHVEAIRCIAQKVLLARGGRLPILSSRNAAKLVKAPEDQQSDDEEVALKKSPEADSERSPTQRKPLVLLKGVPIRLAKATTLPPMTQSRVTVVAAQGGLLFIDPRAQLSLKRLLSAANGIAEARPAVPFEILLENLSKKPVHLHKGQLVANGTRTSVALH